MITIKLTVEQAGLLITAIDAEIARGAGTFLSQRAVEQLGAVANDLATEINLDPTVVKNRIETAVEQYCDASNYDSYYELTPEDIESVAADLQIAPAELAQFLDLVDGVTV